MGEALPTPHTPGRREAAGAGRLPSLTSPSLPYMELLQEGGRPSPPTDIYLYILYILYIFHEIIQNFTPSSLLFTSHISSLGLYIIIWNFRAGRQERETVGNSSHLSHTGPPQVSDLGE